MLKIEKNIPVPEVDYSRCGAPAKYPFKDMEIGDSFVVRIEDSECTTLDALRNAIYQYARRQIGADKVKSRRLDDKTGYRVWRIA